MTTQKPSLPKPVQSEHEPGLWHFMVRYNCGCVLHASGDKPPSQEFDKPCYSCANPAIPEFIEAGKWCRQQRQQTHSQLIPADRIDKAISFSQVAEDLGITVSAVSAMELGRKDPAPLVAYWKELQA